jgi:hypothetical protein
MLALEKFASYNLVPVAHNQCNSVREADDLPPSYAFVL